VNRQCTNRDKKSFRKASKATGEPHDFLPFALGEERQSLNDLFVSSNSHLYHAALRILSNPHDAEDAVQDSLLRAFRSLSQFRGRARFSTWLHRIAVNSSLMQLRKQKSRRESPLEQAFASNEPFAPGIDPPSNEPNPEEQCVRVEQRKLLSEALSDLPRPFRTVIELCDLEELPTREAAQRLGIPLSTAKARLFRARRALRVMILRGRSARPLFPAADKSARWPIPEGTARQIESLPA
jgi:RNA polymerase sigma-70 factor (ECF subfamily)